MSDEYKPEAWRLTDYYPDSYAKHMAALGVGIDYSDDDYDRYHAEFLADLADHDRRIKAEAAADALRRAADDFQSAYWPSLIDKAGVQGRLRGMADGEVRV